MMIPLGTKIRDKITGFEGIAIGRTDWLHGCTRYGVQPQALKDGKPIEPCWFDWQQLEIVTEAPPEPEAKKLGGPQADPVRSSATP